MENKLMTNTESYWGADCVIRLTDLEFKQIVSYTKEHTGINLEKKKILIECRLKSELQKYNMTSFTQYLQKVKYDSTGKMSQDMIDRLSTHYTYFMREPQHFEYIWDTILPEISETRKAGDLTIWCAGCSTGQECYTLVMLFREYMEKGNWLPNFRILATDLSDKALKQAEQGIFEKRELEKLPSHWLEKYFDPLDANTFQIKKLVKQHIQFQKQNLLAPSMERKFDLIMCRNVMIYFDMDAKKTLVHNLERSLKQGGYLFVGHAELLQRDITRLQIVGSAVYQKG